MAEQRKLAAILAADVVGFSRLTAADEERTLARLRALRSDLIDPTISVHRGRVVKRTGDGALVEFASVVDAVRCAIEIQTAMVERNAGLPEDRRIEFRIGVHLGDVVEESDGDLMGDGVNIAARLEGISDPGAIALSEDAYRQVRSRLDMSISDRGETALKNIADPVRVYSIRVGEAAPAAAAEPAARASERPSIAVLPFDNMGGGGDDYFADGMVEDIITGLSRVKWFFVIARNSSFAYKGRSVDIKQVGRELGVRYVLEGSVRRAGERVRVTGQLIEAETGHHVWADRYDRTMDDVFALQDELTMSVVAAIEPSLRQAEIDRVKRERPDSLDAYDLLLRAIPLIYPAMPEGAAQGLALLEQALEKEPNYSLAHGFAAWAQEIILARGGGGEKAAAGAVRHAHAAIAHGRDDPIALSLGAFVLGMVGRDRRASKDAFAAALELSPSCALAYILGSCVLVFDGETGRGHDWGVEAMRLSPLDPMAFAPLLAMALAKFAEGDLEVATDFAQRTFRANPYFSTTHFTLAAVHAAAGRMEEARASAARVLELEPAFSTAGLMRTFDIHPALAQPLEAALLKAGLPE